jgi:4-amino-4-deoxy-L-arabinose transferase-like glycosyltransferase
MAVLLIAVLLAAFVLAVMRKMTAGRLTALLIAAGLILRFGYMLYTPFYIRGHDVSPYGGYGHLDYVYRLFSGDGLAVTFAGQFYHPPLAHAADAAVARLYTLITGIRDPDTIFEASRLIPCFASCALLVVCARLFDALGFSRKARTAALAVIVFHPTFLLLSASINNDMLMVFFFMTAFLYTVRWYRDPSYKNILLIAVFIGCGMSTKFSGALIAVFTAVIFLLVLMQHIREGKGKVLAGRFAAFAAICLPLGLWYQIRNLLLLGQPLGYVAQIPQTSALYIGDIPITERFFSFSLPNMLNTVWCYPFSDDRLWEYTVKCALFGEFVFSPKHDLIARILIVANLVLILLSLIAMVFFLFFDKKRNRFAVLSLFGVWALLMLSFLSFNVKYPFGCTMDFRYIVPTVVAGAAFLGLLWDRLAERRHLVLSGAILMVLGVFCIASAVFYIM